MADKSKLYVVNMTFDGGTLGEILRADPKLVEDWVDAGFVTEVDENGERILGMKRGRAVTDPDADPAGDAGTVRVVE